MHEQRFAEAVPLPAQLSFPLLSKHHLCWIYFPLHCLSLNWIICTSRKKNSFPLINRATIYISRHGDISVTKEEALKWEPTPTSRRTVRFHLVYMAGQSCAMSSSATSAARKKNKSPVQPDAPTPATRNVPRIPPGHQFPGMWPSSFQGSLREVHWRRVLSARPFAFMGVLLMFLRRRVSDLVGDSQVAASHVHLSGRMWLKSVITSPFLPSQLTWRWQLNFCWLKSMSSFADFSCNGGFIPQ